MTRGTNSFGRGITKDFNSTNEKRPKSKLLPFFKIYSKTLDLLYKSNIFALAHFKEIPQNLWRMEFTIKNKKHLASFGHGNTLSDILSLSSEQIEEMGTASLRAVLEQRVRENSKDIDSIPPKDLILVNALILLLDNGIQWTIIKKNLLGSLSGSNRSRKDKQMDGLFNSYIRPIESYSSALNVDSVLNQIGYNF